ncbi:MAG: cyclic lactone autoinducer peptide [Lachnospiraceae bacterium]|nr:cyclic lactone autoinducer peptide [Lachnospiraceae bacterium]
MKQTNFIRRLTQKGLQVLEKRAEKKANAECSGFIYEPKVPSKLKKNVVRGLVCAVTAVSVLAGSVGTYKADIHKYSEWNIIKINQSSGSTTDLVQLYNSNKTYEWAVTSYETASGYGQVSLRSTNCTVNMVSGNNVLTTVGKKRFTVSNPNITDSNPYLNFVINMSYDSYVTRFTGYMKIID